MHFQTALILLPFAAALPQYTAPTTTAWAPTVTFSPEQQAKLVHLEVLREKYQNEHPTAATTPDAEPAVVPEEPTVAVTGLEQRDQSRALSKRGWNWLTCFLVISIPPECKDQVGGLGK